MPRSKNLSTARDAQGAIQAQGGGGGVTVVINSAITERSAAMPLCAK